MSRTPELDSLGQYDWVRGAIDVFIDAPSSQVEQVLQVG
jgi:hypothetical protein